MVSEVSTQLLWPPLNLQSRYLKLLKESLAIGVFIDLKKAIDSIKNSILLDKLNFYSVRGISLSWFQDDLNSRCQFLQLANCRSSIHTIKCGVPQGSLLGSFLFLVYINDIFQSSTFFLQHSNISKFSIVNRALSLVATWFKANKLTLHPDKAKFIIFHPSRKKINSSNLTICIDNSTKS